MKLASEGFSDLAVAFLQCESQGSVDMGKVISSVGELDSRLRERKGIREVGTLSPLSPRDTNLGLDRGSVLRTSCSW